MINKKLVVALTFVSVSLFGLYTSIRFLYPPSKPRNSGIFCRFPDCGGDQVTRPNPIIKSNLPSLNIDPSHSFCNRDGDCTQIFSQCNTCAGTGINKQFSQLYNNQRLKLCGQVDEPQCQKYQYTCIKNQCVSKVK